MIVSHRDSWYCHSKIIQRVVWQGTLHHQTHARLPVPPVRVIRPEDDQKRDAADQDADSVGVAQIVPRHARGSPGGDGPARDVPAEDDEEVDGHGEEAEDRAAVQGRAVDAAEEVQAVYALEVVDHGRAFVRPFNPSQNFSSPSSRGLFFSWKGYEGPSGPK